jgi:hypothetical protein
MAIGNKDTYAHKNGLFNDKIAKKAMPGDYSKDKNATDYTDFTDFK